MQPVHRKRAEQAIKSPCMKMDYLPGGSVGEVWLLYFENGKRAVAKISNDNHPLDIEAWMLRYLKAHSSLALPDIIVTDDDFLLLSHIKNDGNINKSVAAAAADSLFHLHEISHEKFGLHRDTLIGSLPQPNKQADNWIDFFAENRLLYITKLAHDRGVLRGGFSQNMEKLINKLPNYIDEPRAPSLLHGDVWGGNILSYGGCLTGFIDPAIYYGDREIELAYTTMFSTFPDVFFSQYQCHSPLSKNFFTERMPIYHLWPYMCHAVLFGGEYGLHADKIVKKFC